MVFVKAILFCLLILFLFFALVAMILLPIYAIYLYMEKHYKGNVRSSNHQDLFVIHITDYKKVAFGYKAAVDNFYTFITSGTILYLENDQQRCPICILGSRRSKGIRWVWIMGAKKELLNQSARISNDRKIKRKVPDKLSISYPIVVKKAKFSFVFSCIFALFGIVMIVIALSGEYQFWEGSVEFIFGIFFVLLFGYVTLSTITFKMTIDQKEVEISELFKKRVYPISDLKLSFFNENDKRETEHCRFTYRKKNVAEIFERDKNYKLAIQAIKESQKRESFTYHRQYLMNYFFYIPKKEGEAIIIRDSYHGSLMFVYASLEVLKEHFEYPYDEVSKIKLPEFVEQGVFDFCDALIIYFEDETYETLDKEAYQILIEQ